MADLATLQVRVDAQAAIRTTKDLARALENVAQQGPLVSAAMGKTEAQIRQLARAEAAAYREAERMASTQKTVAQNISSMANMARGATTAVAALVGGMAVRGFAQYADTVTLIGARLSLVTKNTEELAYVQSELFESAQRTRSSYEDTAGLYVRVARNMDTLGKSQEEVLRFTELVNMELKIAGASTQEASAGVMQLGQALSKGKLDGDEFRTVLEAMPTVADKLTKSLAGGVKAELFALAKQGKITGADIVDAMLKLENETTSAFSKMPRTIADAWQQSKNDILQSIGDIDKRTKASSFFQFLARGPGILAQSLNPFAEVPGYSPQQRAQQERVNLRMARAQTPEGRAEAAAEAARAEANRIRILREAEEKARRERYDAFLQEKRNADERKQWEEERLKRLERIAQAEYLAAGRARMAAGVGLPTAATARITTVESPFEIMRRALAEQEAERIAERNRAALEARVRGAAFGGVDPSQIRARALPTPTPQEQELLDKKLEQMKMNEEIAKNFRDNMQRSLGDFFTSFIQTGRVSIQALFQGIGGMGANMAGSGIAAVITGALPKAMGPFGSILAGLGLAGIGSLFGRGRGATGPTAEEKLAQAQGRYASIELLRQQRADEMRQFIEGRSGAASRGVVQSIGTVLQETTASRMIGELVAIRVATRQTADAVRGTGGAAGTGTVVNVTVQGGAMATGQEIGEKVAEAVDRLLGTKVQTLRLTSGAAVVS